MPDIWMDVDTAVIVPVNVLPLLDDTDFKTVETAIVYNSSGIAITWNFVTSAGVVTGTAITPTTAGSYDWSEPIADKGMYAIEIPASGGASANNDTEGYGWISGTCTGVLPWRGPVIGFRRAALNDLMVDGGTASTNFEDFFDGTGYAGGTAKLGVDVISISGDATAADNAELFYDGTGYAAANSTVGTVTTLTNKTGFSLAADQSAVTVGTVTTLTNANPTAAAVADAVWDEAAAGHTDAGKAGEQLWTDVDAILVDTSTTLDDLIDTEIATIISDIAAVKGDTAAILVDTGTTLDGRIPAALVGGRMDASVGAMAANVVTASALAADAVDEILDETIGDSTVTMRQALKLLVAALGGKTSGGGTTSLVFRNVADTADVIAATVDVDNNRTAVTLTL